MIGWSQFTHREFSFSDVYMAVLRTDSTRPYVKRLCTWPGRVHRVVCKLNPETDMDSLSATVH